MANETAFYNGKKRQTIASTPTRFTGSSYVLPVNSLCDGLSEISDHIWWDVSAIHADVFRLDVNDCCL